MSHSSYTTSERRGIIIIALVSLLLIAGGVILSFTEADKADAEVWPEIVEHPEIIDSTALESKQKKVSGKVKKNSKKKATTKKNYRRRSPLDEPV